MLRTARLATGYGAIFTLLDRRIIDKKQAVLIKVPEDIRVKAKRALDRMLEIK